jgi:hypothetical protein
MRLTLLSVGWRGDATEPRFVWSEVHVCAAAVVPSTLISFLLLPPLLSLRLDFFCQVDLVPFSA